jgi:NADPH:quinone reductase
MRAIVIDAYGGPEVLTATEIEPREARAGEIAVRITAAGVNFIDVYQRTGRYSGSLPFTPGMEGAGVVTAVGAGVDELRPGDRVAWASQQGSYAEQLVIAAEKAVPLPDGISETTGAAAMLQGMTAHYLVDSTFPLAPSHTALIHAAAGGVGLLLVQMAKRRGARVIGTVSTPEKERLAREAGADEVIRYTERDFEDETRRLTGGAGVDVVYDSVGATTFMKSLSVLRPLGMLVLFGASSGAVAPFDPMKLNEKGSLFLTRPSLYHYVSDREALLRRAGAVFDSIADGSLQLRIGGTYPLERAADAHRELEGRKTTGKLLLEI